MSFWAGLKELFHIHRWMYPVSRRLRLCRCGKRQKLIFYYTAYEQKWVDIPDPRGE